MVFARASFRGAGVDEHVYAVTPTGNVKWTYHTNGSPTSTCHLNPPVHFNCNEIEGSPVVDPNGAVYVGSHDNFMYALNPNGRLKWRFQAGDWINSSPAIGANGALYFGSRDTNFYALEARENRNWRTVSKGTESTVNLDNRYWSH
jgi:outer membrane protein assembly factor BamB